MTYTPPWAADYTSTSNPVPEGVDVGAIVGDVTKDVQQAATAVTGDVEKAATGVVPVDQIPAIPSIGGEINDVIAQAKAAAAKAAEQDVEQRILAALETKVPQAPAAPTLEPKDATNAAARGRALRSLVYGLGLTIFWALVTAIGDAVSGGQVDFFTKTGWISVATLAAGTIAHAVLSYLGRIKFSPNTPE